MAVAIGTLSLKEKSVSKLEMLTPQNSAIALIDYQPAMYQGVQSHDRLVTSNNVQIRAKAAKLCKIPTVLTTVAKDSFSSGRSPLPVARQHASDAAHRLCLSESLSSILWRHGQKYCCLVGWNSVSDWRRELSSKLKRAPLANLSTWSKPTLRSSRCRRKTVRLNLYVKGNF